MKMATDLAQDHVSSPDLGSPGLEPRIHDTTNQHYGDDWPTDDEKETDDETRQTKWNAGAFATGRDRTPHRTITKREGLLSNIRTRPPIGPFSHPLECQKTTSSDLVDFEGEDDPYRPVNWTMNKKIVTTTLYSFTTMSASWGSSSFSPGTSQVAEEFGVGTQVSTLGTTLYLFGFGLGPLLWAPISEVYGRKNSVLPPMFVSACFLFACGSASDIQTIMIARFFAGFFSAAPVTNTGGVLSDLFPSSQRGIAIAAYSMAVVIGPIFGPIVGSALVVQPSLRWRWTEYLTGIIQLFFLVIDIVLLDESYPPRLLVYKARRLRHQSGNWALHAKFEEWDVSIGALAKKFLVRPFQLLATPICALVALYASFCYGILYMQLGAIPIIFGEARGWSQVIAALPFLSILVGAILGAILNIFNQLRYNQLVKKTGKSVVPEARLPPMALGAVIFSGGLFVTGWTADPSHPWIAPCIGIAMVGMGFFTIFQAALNYLVDTFQKYAASAVGANTFLRSCFAGAFPLVVGPLYHNVGIPWGTSIFGFFALLMVPVPFLFMVYGERLRMANKWSRT